MSNHAYHSEQGISKSGLDLIERSPYHYWMSKQPTAPEREETSSQRVGTLAHLMILEPHLFDTYYAIGPDVSRSSKAWKEFADENSGKTIIKPEEWKAATAQARSVWEHPYLSSYKGRFAPEVSTFWFDSETGELCKCRPDSVVDIDDEHVLLLDVKTVTSAHPDQFAKQARVNNYHVQDAWYSQGYGVASGKTVVDFLFICVEVGFPYACGVNRVDEVSRSVGADKARHLLDVYAECRRNDEWPGYPEVNVANLRLFGAQPKVTDEFNTAPNLE